MVAVDDWSDHVFKEDYELPKLSEVENFIKENGHLKNMPSEAKVLEEGYKQHNINKSLLGKGGRTYTLHHCPRKTYCAIGKTIGCQHKINPRQESKFKTVKMTNELARTSN